LTTFCSTEKLGFFGLTAATQKVAGRH
jgi:hypothetical protein